MKSFQNSVTCENSFDKIYIAEVTLWKEILGKTLFSTLEKKFHTYNIDLTYAAMH